MDNEKNVVTDDGDVEDTVPVDIVNCIPIFEVIQQDDESIIVTILSDTNFIHFEGTTYKFAFATPINTPIGDGRCKQLTVNILIRHGSSTLKIPSDGYLNKKSRNLSSCIIRVGGKIKSLVKKLAKLQTNQSCK